MDLANIKGKRAFIYNRISDDREGLALGVERQNEDNHATAERLGAIVVKVFTEFYAKPHIFTSHGLVRGS